jgi:hypothetical protein
MKNSSSSHQLPALNSKSTLPPPAMIAGPFTSRSDGVTSGLVVQRPIGPQASEAAIAERAYAKFVGRGRAHGFDKEDWAAAKHELSDERQKP